MVRIMPNPPANRLVVALAYDGLCTFEFGCAVEVFGLPRPEFGADWYRFATASLEPGPLRMYALGPFAEQTLPEGAGLLTAAAAIAAAIELDGELLQLRIALAGSWDSDRDREQLSNLWQAVSTAPLGRELSLDQPRSEPLVSTRAGALVLAVQLDAERVLQGLERVGAGRLEPLLPLVADPQPPESAH